MSALDDGSDLYAICAEEVHVLERLIAAPAAGVFHAAPPDVVTAEGEIVHAGQVVGSIEVTGGTVTVTSDGSVAATHPLTVGTIVEDEALDIEGAFRVRFDLTSSSSPAGGVPTMR